MVTDYVGINSDDPPFNWNTLSYASPNGSSKGSTYIEGNINYDLLEKTCYSRFQAGKLNLVLHAGYQYVRHYQMLSYTDWRVTLTQTFDWFNLLPLMWAPMPKGLILMHRMTPFPQKDIT